jgi:16S rRNA (guanine(966)-N(2))-methyltransferase RsmD
MRIIAGSCRGRKLVPPGDNEIRPTSDRVKEAVFSMLGFGIHGSRVLDLFAGTGSLGLEALSRGADFATFVEKSAKSIKVLNENINLLGFGERCEVFPADAMDQIVRLGRDSATFDIIFVDPPYMENLYEKILTSIAEYGIIKNGGLVIVEYPAALNINERYHSLTLIKNKKYGTTRVSIFTKGDDNEDSSVSR